MYVLRNDTHFVVSFDPEVDNSSIGKHAVQFESIAIALAFDVYRKLVREAAGLLSCRNYAYLLPPDQCPTCDQKL